MLTADTLEHVRRGAVVVHEANLDATVNVSAPLLSTFILISNLPILVEEGRGERDSLHDKLQVFDALALLLESHRSTVVNVDNNIVKSEANNIHGDLARDPPRSDQLVDALRGALGSLLDARVARRIETLEALLLDSLL